MLSVRVHPVQVYLIAPAMACWGLERLVQTAQPRMELAGTAASIDEALPAMQKYPPDVIVIDVDAVGDVYLRERKDGERFLDTFRRTGIAPFKEAVYADAN